MFYRPCYCYVQTKLGMYLDRCRLLKIPELLCVHVVHFLLLLQTVYIFWGDWWGECLYYVVVMFCAGWNLKHVSSIRRSSYKLFSSKNKKYK